MFIYLIVNHITGKYYVGQHKGADLKKYFQRKFSDARHDKGSSYLFRSMRKHPLPCDWSIHALLSDVQTKAELDQYEKDFIVFLRSRDHEYGYNICKGGEGHTGPHTETTRLKIIENTRRMWQRPGHKERFSAKMTGHDVSPETVDKIKAARALQDESPRIAGCRKYVEEHQEEMSTRLSHEAHVLGGKSGTRGDKQRAGRLGAERGSLKARHTRWHVNRGQTNSGCPLCRQID